jgi:hypothetical protein
LYRVGNFDFENGDRIALSVGTDWTAFVDAEGAWIGFSPNAAVLLAGVDHTQVNAGWFTAA